MMPFRIFTFILATLAFTGCATNLSVTYKSDPPGATLYIDGKSLGYAPVTLQYQVDEKSKQNGGILLSVPTAIWPSGAEVSTRAGIRAELSNSLFQEFTLYRPNDFPGREQDARFGLEVDKMRAEQARADQQAWNNLLLQMKLQQQQQRQQQEQTQIKCLPDGGGGLNCQSY